ncbi:recombinase family protein [Niameybacter massiliensis]|uniref:Recombinase family protein n=1 Tax=Holtiella tumoricola TaxID=3018743 RepID=A0AA42DJ72_9FIRM|nr:recombinase family protein [Holtiella tumoricola]MDA3729912.1 recombinase family protein [Holtiella tumoricola]
MLTFCELSGKICLSDEIEKGQVEQMNIFYIRTSTKEQNEARQIEVAKEYGCADQGKNLFIDKQTGTNFNRPSFEAMKKVIRQDDIVYVHELDRFGRDYTEIKNQIAEIESLGAKIHFLDIPVIQTGDEATDKLLRDQFINTLSYVAQKETEKRKARQVQGIALMPVDADGKKYSSKTGRSTGRPKAELPKDFAKYYKRVQDKEMTATEAMKLMDIKKTSYFKYVKMYKEEQGLA